MPAIAREEYLRRIVDHAEEAGLKAQFDFRQCTIYTKRGEIVAWFDMDDTQNFRLSGRLFKAMSSGLTSQDIGALKEFTNVAGRQTRGTLYAVRSNHGELWSAKELMDGSGVENAASERFNAFYTILGARRLILRYNIPNPKIVPVFDGRYAGVGAYADDLSKGANVPDEVGSDGILKPGFIYDPVTDSRWRQG